MCQIYCLYEPVFYTYTILSHKYAHQKNHNFIVPPLFDFLIKHNLSLIPEQHAKHHQNNKHNYSIKGVMMSNIFRYSKEFKTNKIKMRFIEVLKAILLCIWKTSSCIRKKIIIIINFNAKYLRLYLEAMCLTVSRALKALEVRVWKGLSLRINMLCM